MVSKSVLCALTIVVLATGASTFVTGTQQDFKVCVGALLTVNKHLNLGLNLKILIGNILDGVLDKLDGIFHLILGGLFSGGEQSSICPPPKDLNQALGFVHAGLLVNDHGLRVNIGEHYYKRNYLSQIYIYTCRTALKNANIDITGYTWLELEDGFDFDVYHRELLECKSKVTHPGLLTLFAKIEIFLSTIKANLNRLLKSLLGKIVSISWNLIFGYARGCGYKEYQAGYTTVKTTYTTILTSNGCGTINENYLTSGDYCDACINGS